ncbi:hypothetical protein X777_07377 [Ooceraea biroi]|uniref:Uncharacterized protein n=1 Tax=Ooceraea biroi TaxID=2015173 RepID=A0A026WBP0_OOCBI|nr:hypothetical protein X777_07377 [Ooceraea biroi]
MVSINLATLISLSVTFTQSEKHQQSASHVVCNGVATNKLAHIAANIMCEENSHFDSEMEIFSPTHSYVECNDDMQCDRYLYPEKTYDTQKNMEGEKEFMSEVPEQDENTSYIDYGTAKNTSDDLPPLKMNYYVDLQY